MIKSYTVKDQIGVSVAGTWPDGDACYELEGFVNVSLRKEWDEEEECWRASVIEWYEAEPLVVKFQGVKVPELMTADELPDEVAGEIEWIIERCIS